MFGNVGGRAAIFAAERQTLQQTQTDEDDRGRDADRRGVGQQSDDESRKTHDQDGDEEGVFAADEVANTAEHERAERAHEEARGEGEQREDVTRRGRIGAEELCADDRSERAVKIEVVPFEHRAERRREDHEAFVFGHSSAAR